MKRITKYFFEGLLFLSPVLATIYIVFFVFSKVDRIYGFKMPGAGILVSIAFITLYGFIASNFLTKRITNWVDSAFAHLPLIKMIYNSVKDLINAFVGDKKGFTKPVKVELQKGSGLWVLGFITQDNLSHIGMPGEVAVYVPQSYNFAANLLIVSRALVEPVNSESADMMAFIVSGGISMKKA